VVYLQDTPNPYRLTKGTTMAFTADERTNANKLARALKALLPKLYKATGNLETLQAEDLASLDTVGGGNPSEYLRAARKLLRDASTAWEAAKTALRTNEDLIAAVKHYETAVTCFTQANGTLVLLGAPDADPKPVSKDDKPAKPSGETDETSKPVPAPKPAPATPVTDDKSKDDPKIDPVVKPEPPKAKADDTVDPKDPFAKVLAAINGVRDTCAAQHKDVTDRLEILAGGTLQPARAKAVRDISDDQFANLMRLVSLLTPTGLDTLTAFINLTDDEFKQLMTAGGLTARVEELENWREAGLTLDDLKSLKGKRWSRKTDKTDPTTH
jgi:hypothetical protein